MDLPEIDEIVNEIRNDKVSGSGMLATRVVSCLDNFASQVQQKYSKISPKEYFNEVLTLGQRLVTAQPAMAAVLIGVNEIVSVIKNQYRTLNIEVAKDPIKSLQILCTSTSAVARKYLIESKVALESIANSYTEILEIDDKIMTISASGAVEVLFLTANKNKLDFTVYIPESRPMHEGQMLAERLAGNGIKSVLIADSAMFQLLEKCTKIVVGADRVTPEGIINKIGTRGLAIAAKEMKIPLYCVCETSKLIPDIIPFKKLNLSQPEDQLYYFCVNEDKPVNLAIENIYFDFTPMKYITGFLTDRGFLKSAHVKNYIKKVRILPELVANILR